MALLKIALFMLKLVVVTQGDFMNRQLLIRALAICTASSIVFGLTSCNFGKGGDATSATTSSSIYTEPTTVETSATETEPDKTKIDFKTVKAISVETTEKKKTYKSSGADECAIVINAPKKVSLTTPVINKTGDSSNLDNSKLFGLNSGLLAMNGAKLFVSGGTIETKGKGAAGIFAYAGFGESKGRIGDGTNVTLSDAKVTTSGDDSAGIAVTCGSTLNLTKLTVQTDGKNSPALSIGKDGGIIKITGGTYTTNGTGSPAVTSTGDVTVNSATLVANASEGVIVDDNSSTSLAESNLTANNTTRMENAKFLNSVLLYRQVAGYFDNNTMSSFSMSGGTLTSKSGHIFHITNTKGVINLSNVKIVNEDKENVILSVSPDGWSGNNNVAIFNVTGTTLAGNILVAKEAKLTLNLSSGTDFTGAIIGSFKDADGNTVSTDVGIVHVNLAEGAAWTLTEDTVITSFSGNMEDVNLNGHKLTVNGETTSPTAAPTAKPATVKPTKKVTKKPTKKPKKKATKKPTPKTTTPAAPAQEPGTP